VVIGFLKFKRKLLFSFGKKKDFAIEGFSNEKCLLLRLLKNISCRF